MNLPPRLTLSHATRLLHPSQNAPTSITSLQLCLHSHHLATFGERSLRLGAYASLLPTESVIEQARASDERRRTGQIKSVLDGIPVSIKANVAVGRWWEFPHACSGVLSRGSSAAAMGGGYESDIARRLLNDCGAVLIGITNMDEFGMGSLGTYNGVVDGRGRARRTYNPLPWMERISAWLPERNGGGEEEEILVRRIRESTPSNPHGVRDEGALRALLEEVAFWTGDHAGAEDAGKFGKDCPLLSPGGSSSGAAAATAHGSSLLSIGTDTGGSLRLPAAWTGTVGFKPSYGTWSRYGVVSYASSLDTVGFLVGSMECAEMAWKCLSRSGVEKERADVWEERVCRDSTARVYHTATHRPKTKSLDTETTSSMAEKSLPTSDSKKPLEGIRIGIPDAFSVHEAPPLISSLWSNGARRLQDTGGATLVPIPESKLSSRWVKLSCAAYYVLACAEASSNLSRYDGVRYGVDYNFIHSAQDDVFVSETKAHSALSDMTEWERRISATRVHGFGEEVQRRVLAGTAVLSSDKFHTHYEAAARVRAKLLQSIDDVFRNGQEDRDLDKVDVILIPTALSFPAVLDPRATGGVSVGQDATSAFANDVMTIPVSLGGFPSVSVPFFDSATEEEMNSSRVQMDARHSVGLQLFGPRGSEDLVLRTAGILGSTGK